MKNNPIRIKFNNQKKPNTAFDIVDLEEIFNKEYLDHSPYELHRVEFYIIILIQEGKGKHTIDFTQYPYKKGSVLTVRKNQIHQFHKSNYVKGIAFLFIDDFLVSYLEKLEAHKSLQLFNEILGVPKIQLKEKDWEEVFDIIERIKKEYFKVNDNYSLGIIRSELHILIAKLYRLKSKKKSLKSNSKYLSEFIDFQNLIEQHVNRYTKVKNYAALMGVSTKTLNTITQTIIQKTAKEFIDEICTKQIKRLLINTERPIKEIAFMSGFEETTNFYKYFKRQTKMSPDQFRSNFR